jgi:hypothetical protein
MSDDLDALWAQAKPLKAAKADDLDALWEQAAPRKLIPGKDVPRVSVGRTVADSAADWATAGNQDEAGGLVQMLLAKAANALPRGSLEWAGISNDYQHDAGEIYREGRNENRMLRELGRAQNPNASKVGAALGLGAGLAALPTLGSGTAGALGTGALYGALAGAGRDDADLLEGRNRGGHRRIAPRCREGRGRGGPQDREVRGGPCI